MGKMIAHHSQGELFEHDRTVGCAIPLSQIPSLFDRDALEAVVAEVSRPRVQNRDHKVP